MDTDFFDDLERVRAPERITQRLREAITSGLLRPGERLQQEELAQRLGVSRMPIREALQRLEAEGLVVLQPYRGAVVAGVSARELQEIYEIRIALETLALELGVPRFDQEGLDDLEAILRRMDTEGEATTWLELNTEFHSGLYAAADRALLLEHIDNLRNKSDRYLRLFAARRDRTEQAQQEHWEIIAACRARDTHGAVARLRRHLESTIRSLARTLRDRESEERNGTAVPDGRSPDLAAEEAS